VSAGPPVAAPDVPADPAAPPAVALRGVARRLGRAWVLGNLHLDVAAGRVVVLRGPNGAGKTTLLRLLATRLRPSRGTARVFGFDVVRQGAEVRRRVGLLSAVGGNYPILSARENLRLAAVLGGREDADLEEALARAGLAPAADKLVRTFSSGMKKRLGLARLRLLDPDLWLLDEPYAALDDEGKSMVDDALAAARERGRTVIMASHDLARSARLADAVLELDGGLLRRADERNHPTEAKPCRRSGRAPPPGRPRRRTWPWCWPWLARTCCRRRAAALSPSPPCSSRPSRWS